MEKYKYSGNIGLLLEDKKVAIIGSRKASQEALIKTREISSYLSNNGWVIVSGLAEGIDSAAHEACLESNGKTIAVLGTGLDFIYPDFNKELSREIVKKDGLLLTEYDNNFRGSKWSYPARNKVVVEISEAVIVIEASLKSGTMLTVKEAIKKGRGVWVWGGSLSEGNKYLIESGRGKAFLRACEIKVR